MIFEDVKESELRVVFLVDGKKTRSYICDEDDFEAEESKNLTRCYLGFAQDCVNPLVTRWGQIKKMDQFLILLDGWVIDGHRGVCDDVKETPGFTIKFSNAATGCFAFYLGDLRDYDMWLDYCEIRLDQVESLFDVCIKFVDQFDEILEAATPKRIPGQIVVDLTSQPDIFN